MRVLLNALQAGNRSGTGRYTLELMNALIADPEIDLGVVWPMGTRPGEVPRGARVTGQTGGSLARILADQWTIPRSHARPYDLVHYPANIGPVLPKGPTVLTVHDLSFCHHPEWFSKSRAAYYRWAVPTTARSATRVIADSEMTRNDLVALARVPHEKIDVVPLGVSAAFRPVAEAEKATVRARYSLPARFFLFVGTLEPRKNLPRLIAAWSSLARELPEDLVIVGRPGWRHDELGRALAKSAHRDRIHMTDHIPGDDLPAVLGCARAFAWPSLFEGFGLPPLEAMACGTPVITSNTSSLPEVVGDAAITVDPESESEIAAALERLSADDELCADLARRGLARAETFGWERTARETVRAYCRI